MPRFGGLKKVVEVLVTGGVAFSVESVRDDSSIQMMPTIQMYPIYVSSICVLYM